MEIPDFRRGEQLTARKLNQLANELRLARLMTGPGYTLTQTPGGTVINLQQAVGGVGGGGGAVAARCNFKVTDASDPETSALTLKVQVDKIQGRYPWYMVPGEDFLLPLDDRFNEWAGIYLQLKVDEFGDIRPEPEAIAVVAQWDWKPSGNAPGNQTQYIFLAGVSISHDKAGKRYISLIENACPTDLAAHSVGGCNFEIDDSGQATPTIVIKTGKVDGKYPTGMAKQVLYSMAVPDDADWYAVYMVLALDYKGDIKNEENSITFALEQDYVDSTAELQYVLLGEVTVSTDNEWGRYISYIVNYCATPTPMGMSSCRWELIKAGDLKVRIRNASVNGKYPAGMSATSEYDLDIPTNQDWHAIYAVMVLNDDGTIDTSPSGLTLSVEDEYKQQNENTYYFLVGEVVISDKENGGGKAISWLRSECPYIFPPGGGGGSAKCPFKVSDASIAESTSSPALTIRINIAYGLVQNRVPDGMIVGSPYILTQEDTSKDATIYVWCVLSYDPNTLFLDSENSAITFELSTDLKQNGASTEYVLVGACVLKAKGGPDDGPYIKEITSVCGQVTPNPCNLAWVSHT